LTGTQCLFAQRTISLSLQDTNIIDGAFTAVFAGLANRSSGLTISDLFRGLAGGIGVGNPMTGQFGAGLTSSIAVIGKIVFCARYRQRFIDNALSISAGVSQTSIRRCTLPSPAGNAVCLGYFHTFIGTIDTNYLLHAAKGIKFSVLCLACKVQFRWRGR